MGTWRELMTRWFGRNAQGIAEAPAVPRKRLQVPELRKGSLGYAARRILPSLTPERITAIFSAAEYRIADQIELAHVMEETDDHLRGTLALRRAAVQRMQVRVEPGDKNDPRSVEAAKLLERCIQQPWFKRASDWLLRATLLQWAAVEVCWEEHGPRWMPASIREVEPGRWHFDRDGHPRLFRNLSARSESDTIEPVAGKYMVHSWDASSLPGDFALVRAVARLWLLGRLDLTEWGRMLDKWAMPFVDLQYAEGLSPGNVADLIDDMVSYAGERVLAHPAGTSVQVHPVPDQSPHLQFQDWIRRCTSRLLLGQDSSQMLNDRQQTGATLQGAVRDDIRDADAAALDASQTMTLAEPLCRWNFGHDVAPPRISRVIPEQLDPEKRARVFMAAQRAGVRLKSEQVYRELGLKRPDGVPDVIEPPATVLPVTDFSSGYRTPLGGP